MGPSSSPDQYSTRATPPSSSPDPETLSQLPLEVLQTKLGTSPQGLSKTEASQRLAQDGYNQLPETTVSPLMQFLSHFWGPIAWMIEAAVILSALVGDWVDFGLILALLIANGVVGFWEEFQAGNAIAALQAKLALQARVKRDGHWTTVPARELVAGDVIRLRLGDIVPADVRFLSGDPVQVDQSALTGESLPVECKVGDVLYSSSILKRGELDGLVYATGVRTYMGNTARLVASAQTVSHFQRAVLKIRRLPDRHRSGAGGAGVHGGAVSGRPLAHHPAVCAGADGGLDSGGDAHHPVSDHGSGSAATGEKRCHRQSAGGDRRDGGHRHSLF
jgi:magnesium-transporting ATPase (P-type)